MVGARTVAALVAPAVVFAATTATAASGNQPEAVQLVLPPCAELPFDAARLRELLRLELDAMGVRRLEVSSATEPGEEGPAWVVLTLPNCSPAAEDVALGLLDTRTGRRADADMHIADLPTGLRSRAIAIRIVELLRAKWPELAEAPAASAPAGAASTVPSGQGAAPGHQSATPMEPRAAEPVANTHSASAAIAPPTQHPQAETVASQHDLRWVTHVEAELGVAAFPSRSTGLVGPAGTVALIHDRLRISAGALGYFGNATAPGGSADIGWVSGFLSAGVAGRFVVLEPRLLLGYAWASGTTSDVQKVLVHSNGGFAGLVALTGGVRGAIARGIDAAVDVSVGYAFEGVSFTTDDVRFAGVSGAMIGAAIGLSLRP